MSLINNLFTTVLIYYIYFRFLGKRQSCLKDETVEDKEDNKRAPVVDNDESGVEDWILEELHHTLARIEISLTREVFPAKDTDKKEDGWDRPGDDNHGNNLDSGDMNTINYNFAIDILCCQFSRICSEQLILQSKTCPL